MSICMQCGKEVPSGVIICTDCIMKLCCLEKDDDPTNNEDYSGIGSILEVDE